MERTEDGIYYLSDYVPKRALPNHSKESVENSKRILDFKDGDRIAIGFYAMLILKAIAELAPSIRASRIALVAVPPSKVHKYSPVREMIEMMVRISENSDYLEDKGCFKTLLDYKDLLQRMTDVRTSHYGLRASYEDHINSIACGSRFSRRMHFIVLDDVTTTGVSMMACQQVLIDSGVPKRNITCLAISKTVWSY